MNFTFYLGTHKPHWLWEHPGIPYFVSDTTLRQRKSLKPASAPWCADSGGFSELKAKGAWTVPPLQYATRLTRYANEIGHLAWAAPQDWMCEPMIRAKTGQTIEFHQERTIDSVLEMRSLTEVPIIPVLQGWEANDYLRHREMYEARGFDLTKEPTVGIGSVCRRQSIGPIRGLIEGLAGDLRLHAFGFKKTGLPWAAPILASADSTAWSYGARFDPPRMDCPTRDTHKNCANCFVAAKAWLDEVLAELHFDTGSGDTKVKTLHQSAEREVA